MGVPFEKEQKEDEDLVVTGHKDGSPTACTSCKGENGYQICYEEGNRGVLYKTICWFYKGREEKRVPARLHRASTDSIESTSLVEKSALSGRSIEDDFFDLPTLSEVRQLLEFQGWMPLFKNVKNAFVDVVREFYVNLLRMSFSSYVFKSEISMFYVVCSFST